MQGVRPGGTRRDPPLYLDHRVIAIGLGALAFVIGGLGAFSMDAGQWAGFSVVIVALIAGEVGYANGEKAGRSAADAAGPPPGPRDRFGPADPWASAKWDPEDRAPEEAPR
jgi:hypothetical protein